MPRLRDCDEAASFLAARCASVFVLLLFWSENNSVCALSSETFSAVVCFRFLVPCTGGLHMCYKLARGQVLSVGAQERL